MRRDRRTVNLFSESGKKDLFTMPAASSGHADTETGAEFKDDDQAGENTRQALFALDSMFKRGLIPEAVYKARRAEIEGGNG